MRCRTHMTAANASMLLILNPQTPKELLIAMSACTIGSVISDLDIRTSDAHKYIDAVTIVTFIFTIIFYICDLKYNYGIFSSIKNGPFYLPILGILIILGTTFFGSHQPHRSFLHSFFGAFVLTLTTYLCFGNVWIPFLIGIISHILLDLFNKKSIRLFYPSKKGYYFNLCEYGGLLDKILFYVSLIICILKLFAF